MNHEALDSGIDSGGNPAIREREYRRAFRDTVYKITQMSRCLGSVVALVREMSLLAGDAYNERIKLHKLKPPYSEEIQCQARAWRGVNHAYAFAVEGLKPIYFAEHASSILTNWAERVSSWESQPIEDGKAVYPPEMGER